jgi:hypothetical protein
MPIVINSNIPLVAAQGVAADVVLQPGSVISATVLQVLGNDTAQIAIGGQAINVLSQVPLQPGQTLQLAVSQTSDGIRLAVVDLQGGASASQGSAGAAAMSDTLSLAPEAAVAIAAPTTPGLVVPKNQLTPLETLAVSIAAESAATQQTSLAPLFANLDVAAGLNGLPPQVQLAVAQLLAQRTKLDPGLTGNDIKQAFQNSGLFLESSLASGSLSPSAATPDLKAALIVLRQVLTTSLGGAPATQSAPPPAVAVQQGAMPAASLVQQGAAPVTAAVVQQGTAPQSAATAPGATPPAVVAQQGTTPGAVVLAQGTQPSFQMSQISSQPVTITVGPETFTTAAPALAPLLVSEVAASGVSLQGVAQPSPEDGFSFSAANQVIPPASMPMEAAARAAASSAALNLLQEALQATPLTAGNSSRFVFDDGLMLSLLPAVAGARPAKVDDAEFARTNVPPPPISGALPAAQPVMPAMLSSNSPLEAAMRHLLADTDGAIARQTLLQVASLPDRVDAAAARIDQAMPRWNFEIPFATPQGTAMAQFEISRDGSTGGVEAAKRVWRARFSLDIEPAGPVHALISLSGERTSVRLWAERPATSAQLRAGAAQLSQALGRAELQPGDIVIRDGAPVQTASAPAGHFLDRAL